MWPLPVPALTRLAPMAAFVVALCATRSAHAQVNVEPLRDELKQDGIGARIAAGLSGYAGNTEGIVLSSAFLIGGRSGRHFGYSSASADYARLNGSTQVSKSFAHTRHNYELTPAVWSELFGQIESDRFRRIALRELVGVGLRFGVVRGEELRVFLGAAYMLEYTRLNASAEVRDRTDIAQRLSSYATLTATFTKQIVFSETLYFQPRLDDVEDLHLLSISGLRFELAPRLTSRIDCTLRYESREAPNTKPYDLEIKNSLELRF